MDAIVTAGGHEQLQLRGAVARPLFYATTRRRGHRGRDACAPWWRLCREQLGATAQRLEVEQVRRVALPATRCPRRTVAAPLGDGPFIAAVRLDPTSTDLSAGWPAAAAAARWQRRRVRLLRAEPGMALPDATHSALLCTALVAVRAHRARPVRMDTVAIAAAASAPATLAVADAAFAALAAATSAFAALAVATTARRVAHGARGRTGGLIYECATRAGPWAIAAAATAGITAGARVPATTAALATAPLRVRLMQRCRFKSGRIRLGVHDRRRVR